MFKLMVFFLVLFVLVVVTSVILFFLLRRSPSRNKYVLAGALLLFVILVFILPSLFFTKLLTFWELFSYASEILNSHIGLSIWLNRAIVVFAIFPLLWALREIFSFDRKRRRVGYIMVASYACAYFLMMYFATTNVYFRHDTGGAQKWVYISHTGEVREYDSDGYDVITGEPLQGMTHELYDQIKLARKLQVQDYDLSGVFFHPATGKAIKYYTIDGDGQILVHDEGGFDTYTGQPLRPITREIVSQFLRQEDSIVQAEMAAEQEQARIEQEERREAQEWQTRANRLHEQSSLRAKYLTNAIGMFENESDVAIVYTGRTNSVLSSQLSQLDAHLRNRLNNANYNVVESPFKGIWVTDGFADSLLHHNNSVFDKMNISRTAGLVVIIDIDDLETTKASFGDLYEKKLSARIVGVEFSGGIVFDNTILVGGVGKDNDQMIMQGITEISKKLSEVFQPVKTVEETGGQ